MKDQLENRIKQSLNGFEAPYNPVAWEAMRAKLDATRPTTTAKPKGKAGYWIAATLLVAGVSAVAYFGFKNNNEQISHLVDEPVVIDQTTVTNSVQENQSTISNDSEGSNEIQETAEGNTTTNPGVTTTPALRTHSTPILNNSGEEQLQTTIAHRTLSTPNNETGNNQAEAAPSAVVLPQIGSVCQNDLITVENINDQALIVNGPDQEFVVPANETRKIRIKSSGVYTITGTSTSERVDFVANAAPNADFTIDEMTKFEDGIPTTIVETTSHGTQYEWIINGARLRGNSAKGHFYTKGNHDVTLVVEGSNGCRSTLTKSVYVDENYNLMAMNSFRPNSLDPTTNTFMPYALKLRDVKFSMIIIDPKDGQLIYETNDPNEGWNGIDRRSGQLVTLEKVYIWKVTIENKSAGEAQNEYSGQVIPVPSSK